MAAFTIAPATDQLVSGLARLKSAATIEGIAVVSTVMSNWTDGSQQFDSDGESLRIALDQNGTGVGVGGISRCPHVEGALRMRRFYIHPEWRRCGVARALAESLIESSLGHADLLTCNAQASLAAPPFWESLGFVATETPGITHTRRHANLP